MCVLLLNYYNSIYIIYFIPFQFTHAFRACKHIHQGSNNIIFTQRDKILTTSGYKLNKTSNT